MKLRHTLLFAFLLLFGLVTAHAQSHAEAPASAHETAAAAHEGGQMSIGDKLVELLSEHLVDAHEFQFFGMTVHLPEFKIGPFVFITKHQVWWVIACLLVLLVARIAGRQRTAVPTGLRNALEVIAVFLRDEVLRPNLHDRADAFLPYFLTLFTAILFSNLLGLLPWGSSATGNVNVTAGLALCSLGLMIGMGIRQQGFANFLHVFAPPGVPAWLMPLMVVVEIVSFLIRPFALTIRLFANMLAGHAVVAVLFGLIVAPLFAFPSIAVATGVTLLEILVALIQSYIFVMLTAVFMGLTMHPSH
ncbi:MAG TPA: F0F1 ATP synthase subunit A [bacterium]|jgi:F-type H+-transporting ATPase subunit a